MTEAACRLYLTTPDGLAAAPALEAFTPRLEAALAAGDVAALLIRRDEMDDHALARAAARLGPPAQALGVAVLVEDSARIAATVDGVHLTTAGPKISALRQEIGPEAIVGVECGRSKHLAMKAGEAGADYIAFGLGQPLADNDLELVAWWQEMMVVPQVVMTTPSLEGAGDLARAGADFLALGAPIWDHPEGPARAVEAFSQALALGAGRC